VVETFGKRVILYNMDENARNNINRIFNKDESNYRKRWMSEYKEAEPQIEKYNNTLYKMNITEFINNSLIQFSIDDCKRSIPNIMDGMKESNRKILYACILKNIQKSIKVNQLAGFVAEKTNYHHGEDCLLDTIVSMAQDFVGSNNIPLLFKDGAFGTRLSGGRDAASARYIFTKLSDITRSIFHPDDDDVLTYLDDDGDTIEPEYYAPIIPMILVNGANGIGTGWSSTILSYNPLVLIEWIRCWITDSNKEDDTKEDTKDEINYPELIPWYRGFTGEIRKVSTHKFESIGRMEKSSNGKYKLVTELPVGVWTDKYKEFLEDLLENRKIKSLKNYSNPESVHFEITELKDNPLTPTKLKLKSILTTTNLVLFDENNRIRKFDKVEDIMRTFCKVRADYYVRRKEYITNKLITEYTYTKDKIRFITYVNSSNNPLVLYKRKEEDIIKEMKDRGLKQKDGSYEYLLSLQVRSFSDKKVDALNEKKNKLKEKINYIKSREANDIWLDDLKELEQKLNIGKN
jgi:DNA topoisomerase-2